MSDNNSIIHSTLEEGYDFFITDKWNKKYHFKIATLMIPSGYLSEAIEVIDDFVDNEPQIFHVLADFDSDSEKSELLLKAKIKKAINIRYLDYHDGDYSIGDDLEVVGRILWDDNQIDTGFDNYFEINGKRITIEKFIKMLQCFEGWKFKFKIFDTTDDIE